MKTCESCGEEMDSSSIDYDVCDGCMAMNDYTDEEAPQDT